MSDDITNLKAELQLLDGRIQAERNDEVRHGLQRGRLEAERSQLLVKLITACGAAPTAIPPPYVVAYATADAVKPAAVVARSERVTFKPAGTPPISEMIITALADASTRGRDCLRPCEIAAYVRRTWWPDVKGSTVSTRCWELAQSGKLSVDGGRYRLNKANGAATSHDAHAEADWFLPQ